MNLIKGNGDILSSDVINDFNIVPKPQYLIVRQGAKLKVTWPESLSSLDIAERLDCGGDSSDWSFDFTIEHVDLDNFNIRFGQAAIPGFDRQEGYMLSIDEGKVTVGADSAAGRFYALQTLAQIMAGARSESIPGLLVVDWPDLKTRCFNISFYQNAGYMQSLIPNFDAMLAMVREYAHLKMNAFLFEPDCMFPFERHPEIPFNTAFTRPQLEELRKLCARCHVGIIPLVQSIGHVYGILRHPEYAHLRELPDTTQQYCPCKDEVRRFYLELIDEVIEVLGPVRYLHMGGDESRRLGKCPECAKKLAAGGMGALYGDHINELGRTVMGRGIQPLVWGDIMEDHPDILNVLDPGIGIVYWNYDMVDWNRPYVLEQFVRDGRTVFGGCAAKFGDHSDYMHLYKKAMRNIGLMAAECRRNELEGIIVTDWTKLAPTEAGIVSVSYGASLSWSFGGSQRDFASRFSKIYFGLEIPELDDVLKLVSEVTLNRNELLNNYWCAPYCDQNEDANCDFLDRCDWSGRDFSRLLRKYTRQELSHEAVNQMETGRMNASKALTLLGQYENSIVFKKRIFDVIKLAAESQYLKCCAGLALDRAIKLLKYPEPLQAEERGQAAAELAGLAADWRAMGNKARNLLLPGTIAEILDNAMYFKFDPDAPAFMERYAGILESGGQLMGLLNFKQYE